MSDSEKKFEEKLRSLEREVERLQEIRYKYYCLGFIYFFILALFLLMSPNGLGNFGSDEFNSNLIIICFISLIFFSLIFFGEIIIKFFQFLFKSKQNK